MITPEYLTKGDKIGIVSPAGRIDSDKVDHAVSILEKHGLKVLPGSNVFNTHHRFAGTDDERAEDLQKMLDNKDIKAIMCSRGGYGTIRILSKLNFDGFIRSPKWIAGFSDITILHSVLQSKLNTESIHATMPKEFIADSKGMSVNSLLNVLFGKDPEYDLESHKLNRKGNVKGVLAGGNLSVLYSLSGTPYEQDLRGKILFIEDINEYLYHLDRVMINFKLRGILSGLSGLIVGAMNNMKDDDPSFGKTAYEIISEAVSDYDYPVCYGFSAGHINTNLAMILGREIELDVKKDSTNIKFLDKK